MDLKFDFNLGPVENFRLQLSEAEAQKIKDPNAMILSTVDIVTKVPSSRTVLFKGFYEDGWVFYTNYNSQKSQEITQNPNVSLLFFWPNLERQVRIVGFAQKTPRSVSEDYFKTRPRESQLGAWASDQSKPIENYDFLEEKIKELEQKYKGQEIPCPPHWGGWLVQALEVEFWFGRVGRLHERYVYQRTSTRENWKTLMKSP